MKRGDSMQRDARNWSLLLLLPFMGFIFAGCPHHVSNMIDEMLPPENYDPDYLSSTIGFADLLSEYRAEIGESGTLAGVNLPPDTLFAESTNETPSYIRGTRVGPIAMDLRSVDDNRYPDQIVLQAYVFDTAGRYISGLAPPTFEGVGEVTDYWTDLVDSCGGVATAIGEYTVEEVSEESRTPYSIAIALDHSGSMGQQRVRVLRRAVGLLLRGVSKRDNVSIISFDDSPFVEVPMTSSKREWVTKFDTADLSNYGGGTAMYDAVVRGVGELKKGPDTTEKILILFSDGGDNGAGASLESAYQRAREAGVTIYTIAYGPADRETLQNLAGYTGGRMYRIYSSGEFLDVFIDLYRRLTRFYRITYTPPECAGLHTVRASLAIPDLGVEGLFGEGIYDRSVLTPFDSVGSIVFVGIEFDYNKATVREESYPRIAEVVDAMQRNPDIEIEIRGHTDDSGEEEYNLDLSERRAKAVAERIVESGISRGRLRVKGFGESRPIVPNDSEENRKKNRRTEFVILKK